jgi:tetratricopeptide (TPR) repeat protein
VATLDEAINLAFNFAAQGRVAEAERVCLAILDPVPDSAAAAYLLGQVRAGNGRYSAAAGPLGRALVLDPGNPAFLVAVATLALVRRDVAGAASIFRRSTRVALDNAEAWSGLAAALRALGRTVDSLASGQRALALAPSFADAWINRADAAAVQKDSEITAFAANRALRLAPGRPAALVMHGVASMLNGDDGAAETALREALARDPAVPGGWENLGSLHARRGRAGEAETAFAEAARRRDGPELWAQRGAARLGLGHPEEALADLDRAARARPDDHGAIWNRGLARLTLGDLPGGWEDMDHRRIADRGVPPWRGGEIAGRRLLLFAEQGLGDTLHFVRYAPLAAALGARVVLEVQPALKPLMTGLPGVEAVVAMGEAVPAVDLACPLMSLPRAFATAMATIPAGIPYLASSPDLVRRWGERMAGEGPRVGLVWAGNPEFAADRHRSPGLASLRPLLDVPGIRFFGLQKGAGRADLDRVRLPPSFTDLGAEIDGFADTAAIMANLDLVISSCTGPAHLAGALGRPLWLALGYAADWRWFRDRDDSPWYPTARLFRQTAFGDWAGVAARMTAALAAWWSPPEGGASPNSVSGAE